ncbi:virulence factor family protein [Pseudomonas sp. Marseille-QA0892]
MRKVLLFLVVIVAAAFLSLRWWSQRWPTEASVQELDGGSLLALPAGEPRAQVLIAAPAGEALSESELLALAQKTGARFLQYGIAQAQDCMAHRTQLNAAIEQLGATPDWVAGIGAGGVQAWRWLAAQNEDGRNALSVGSKIAEPDCGDPWPEKAKGKWHLAWNDNPGDDTAVFVRNQPNADTTISDYDTPLKTVLQDQLLRQLQGRHSDVPTIEIRPEKEDAAQGDTVTIFYSGDGGWRDLDHDSAETMAKHGYPVVGVDALRYFWEHKSPERIAADLSKLMQHYREVWAAKHFVLAGYSFGADILPAVYNRLPAEDQNQVTTMLLLAFARSGDFEIQVTGWLGKPGDEAQTGPEMVKVPASKIYCIYGAEERDESGCTQPGAIGERLELPGGHHYDGDYDRLAQYMMKAIDARTPRP